MKPNLFFAPTTALLAVGILLAGGCQPAGLPIGTVSPSPSSSPSLEPTEEATASPDPSATQSPGPTPMPFSLLVTVAGYGAEGFANGTGSAVGFRYPAGLALHPDGTLLVADQQNHRIRRMTLDGVVTTFAGLGTAGTTNGATDSARFNTPIDVAADASGSVYVADLYNRVIRKIDVSGQVSTFAGGMGTAPAHLDGTGTNARFGSPEGIAVDASGSVYVADSHFHRIRKISPQGEVTTLAGTGESGFADGDAQTEAKFNQPYDVVVDASGKVYVLDRQNARVRVIGLDGQVSTLAGSGQEGHQDGAGASATFNKPVGLALGPDGHVYVADGENHRIRRIAADGTVSTVAGNGEFGLASGWGYSPRVALTTPMKNPRGLVVTASGSLYVSELWNHVIRRLY